MNTCTNCGLHLDPFNDAKILSDIIGTNVKGLPPVSNSQHIHPIIDMDTDVVCRGTCLYAEALGALAVAAHVPSKLSEDATIAIHRAYKILIRDHMFPAQTAPVIAMPQTAEAINTERPGSAWQELLERRLEFVGGAILINGTNDHHEHMAYIRGCVVDPVTSKFQLHIKNVRKSNGSELKEVTAPTIETFKSLMWDSHLQLAEDGRGYIFRVIHDHHLLEHYIYTKEVASTLQLFAPLYSNTK